MCWKVKTQSQGDLHNRRSQHICDKRNVLMQLFFAFGGDGVKVWRTPKERTFYVKYWGKLVKAQSHLSHDMVLPPCHLFTAVQRSRKDRVLLPHFKTFIP